MVDDNFKKGTLTIKYDEKQLGKTKESNLVIGYYKNFEIVLLKTKVDKKNHTVTAAYCGGNEYFILDQAQYKKSREKK
ncbi:MAG: hypothetical protein PUC65_12845 [Clostridiales bacterium]|nr:hypothetical protein [Clostridiales bacterium]